MINRCETCGASWYADQPAKHLMTCSPTPTEAGSLPETRTVAPTMREKMARRMADSFGLPYDGVPEDKHEWLAIWQKTGKIAGEANGPFKSDYRDMADAALDALMEPTEGMLREAGMGATCSTEDIAFMWVAMIDAASPEDKP